MANVHTPPLVLPFVRRHTDESGELDIWFTLRSGDWAADNAKGREYANACIDYMRHNRAPGFLGHVVKAMIGKAQFGGVEVGFFAYIADRVTKA